MTDVLHLLVGPSDHGVVRWATDIALALRAPTLRRDDPAQIGSADVAGVAAVHVHVTDRLFGPDATTASHRFAAMVDRLAVPVGVTLHDIPQASDGGAFVRRSAAYRVIAGAARGVVVSSNHERSLLREAGWEGSDPEVIPLALTAPLRRGANHGAGDREVGVFGYLYPGKGHVEVLEAAASLDPDVGVIAIGGPAPGHDDLVDELHRRADRLGRRLRVTGFVGDDVLTDTLQAVTVPVAHHRHLSASGSIPTWIAAGRRPLAPHGRYIDELADRSPGVVLTYPDDDLAGALRHALAAPATTWLDEGVAVRPTWDDVVAMYRAVFSRWAA